MIGEPFTVDSRTYYISDNKVVEAYVQSTSLNQDMVFLATNPDNVVTGTHLNGMRWVYDRSKLNYKDPDNTFFNALTIIGEDHPIYKLVEMYKLVGALPDALDDWSNDGRI